MTTTPGPVSDEDVLRLQQDGEWFQQEYQNLRSEYEGRFIAIYDQEVIDAADTRADLRHSIEDSTELDPRRTLIEYVPGPDHSLQMVRNIPRE